MKLKPWRSWQSGMVSPSESAPGVHGGGPGGAGGPGRVTSLSRTCPRAVFLPKRAVTRSFSVSPVGTRSSETVIFLAFGFFAPLTGTAEEVLRNNSVQETLSRLRPDILYAEASDGARTKGGSPFMARRLVFAFLAVMLVSTTLSAQKVEVSFSAGYTLSEGIEVDPRAILGQVYDKAEVVSGASFNFTGGVYVTPSTLIEFLYGRQSSKLTVA